MHFNFTDKDKWACAITDRNKGVFGWVTTNDHTSDDAPAVAAGALDLGGVSLQITLLPDKHPKNNSSLLVLPNNVLCLHTQLPLLWPGHDSNNKHNRARL